MDPIKNNGLIDLNSSQFDLYQLLIAFFFQIQIQTIITQDYSRFYCSYKYKIVISAIKGLHVESLFRIV